MNRIAIKGAAYPFFKNGFRVLQIFQFLVVAFGEACVKTNSVHNWIRQMKVGTFSFKDHPQSGRPKPGRSERNIQLIKEKIETNDNVTVRTLCLETGLSYCVVHSIMKFD